MLTTKGFSSDVSIELDIPIELPDSYVEKHKTLSKEDRLIHILFRGEKIFSTTVPRNVFNPYKGIAANKLIELILYKEIRVENKRVIDLGCGSGVIGFACIHAGSSSVLFTDINPHTRKLKQNPIVRKFDTVRVQNLLEKEERESYDVIIMSTPTDTIGNEQEIHYDSIESAIFRPANFLLELVDQAARCLVPEGELALWLKISHRGILYYHELIIALNRYFDLDTMKIFAHALDSEVIIGEKERYEEFSHLVFSIKKKKFI
jgi:SAM-dependent methyltransferase